MLVNWVVCYLFNHVCIYRIDDDGASLPESTPDGPRYREGLAASRGRRESATLVRALTRLIFNFLFFYFLRGRGGGAGWRWLCYTFLPLACRCVECFSFSYASVAAKPVAAESFLEGRRKFDEHTQTGEGKGGGKQGGKNAPEDCEKIDTNRNGSLKKILQTLASEKKRRREKILNLLIHISEININSRI